MDGMQGLRALIYGRESKTRDGRSISVSSQIQNVRSDLEHEGCTIVATIAEPNRSASRFATRKREKYAEVLQWVSSGEIDVLATWEASRRERDVREFLTLSDACRDTGVRLWYDGKLIDLDNPNDEFQAIQDVNHAQRESGIISKRVRRGMKTAAELGRPHGRPPYGLRRAYVDAIDDNGKPYKRLVWEIDPERASITREIVTRLLEGESIYRILGDLHEREIPAANGSPWARSSLRALALNPQIAGMRVYQGQTYKAEWPEIISEEEHHKVRALLLSKETHGRPGATKYLLANTIAKCGVCGIGMRRQSGAKGKPDIYACRPRGKGEKGGHVARSREKLDNLVTMAVLVRLTRPDLAQTMTTNDAAMTDAIRRRDLAESRLEELKTLVDKEEIDYAEYASFSKKPKRQRDDAVRELDALQPSSPAPGLELRDRLIDGWDDLAIEQRKAVIRSMVQVKVLPQTGHTWRPEFLVFEWRTGDGLQPVQVPCSRPKGMDSDTWDMCCAGYLAYSAPALSASVGTALTRVLASAVTHEEDRSLTFPVLVPDMARVPECLERLWSAQNGS